jgi:2-polyprenyl-6-methoxyphenol hydroxylase-like FAD-dependent oxidoreductase
MSLDQVLRSVGLADALVQEGIVGTAHQMYDGPYRFLHMPYTCLEGKTSYPFNLMLAQHQTERILISELTSLGVSIKWEHKAISISASDGGATVGFENGSTIAARYVVGADGSHSSVRITISF